MTDENNTPKLRGLMAPPNQPAPVLPLPPLLPTFLFEPFFVDRRVYKNTAINLDGYTFSNCVFIDCELTTSKANFGLQDCHLQNCKIFFSGNALRAVKLSSSLLHNFSHLPESLRAHLEPDGGFTVE
jgi:hypothetical protein